MQLPAGRASELGHPALHRGVDVLVGVDERERAVGQLAFHPVEGVEHRRHLGVVEDAGAAQPADVGPAAGDVVGGEALVEREAHRVGEQRLGRPAGEPSVPQRGHGREPGPWR